MKESVGMEIIVNDIIDKVYRAKPEIIARTNKYDIIFFIMTLIFIILLPINYWATENEKRIASYILFVLILICVVFMLVLISLSNKTYYRSQHAKQNRIEKLNILSNVLQNNDVIAINHKKEIIFFTKKVKKYYKEKFLVIDTIEKLITNLGKILLIPIVLALTNYILNINDETLEDKLIFIFIFLMIVFLAIYTIYFVLHMARAIIKFYNSYVAILIADLELLSSFNVRELNKDYVSINEKHSNN